MGVWFCYAFQAVATTLVLLPRDGVRLRTAHPRYLLLRRSLLLASSTLAFLSLRSMLLAELTLTTISTGRASLDIRPRVRQHGDAISGDRYAKEVRLQLLAEQARPSPVGRLPARLHSSSGPRRPPAALRAGAFESTA